MKPILSVATVTGLAAAFVACSGVFAPDQSIVLGVSKLDAPATISAGSSLTVVLTVTTGGCTSFDHIAIGRSASTATLTAWGIDASKGRKGIACPTYLVETPHSY